MTIFLNVIQIILGTCVAVASTSLLVALIWWKVQELIKNKPSRRYMKTLFHFRSSGIGGSTGYEIFADTIQEAQQEIKIITSNTLNCEPTVIFVTQNYDCPKCSCHATECNYGEV